MPSSVKVMVEVGSAATPVTESFQSPLKLQRWARERGLSNVLPEVSASVPAATFTAPTAGSVPTVSVPEPVLTSFAGPVAPVTVLFAIETLLPFESSVNSPPLNWTSAMPSTIAPAAVAFSVPPLSSSVAAPLPFLTLGVTSVPPFSS